MNDANGFKINDHSIIAKLNELSEKIDLQHNNGTLNEKAQHIK